MEPEKNIKDIVNKIKKEIDNYTFNFDSDNYEDQEKEFLLSFLQNEHPIANNNIENISDHKYNIKLIFPEIELVEISCSLKEED